MAQKKVRLMDNDPLQTKTDSILSGYNDFGQANKQESQPVNKSGSKQVVESEAVTTQLKKATYQLDASVLEKLDRTYLKMSLDRGKQATPYKEVLVETAINLFLEKLEEDPSVLELALSRQKKRH
jgi:hypothetical protein